MIDTAVMFQFAGCKSDYVLDIHKALARVLPLVSISQKAKSRVAEAATSQAVHVSEYDTLQVIFRKAHRADVVS